MQDQGMPAPPAFAKLPKSELFSRLEVFLPAMAAENEKLEAAVAAGHGDDHNIEVEEEESGAENSSEEEEEDTVNGQAAKPAKKKQVIQMDFALGVMENDSSDSSDAESDGEGADALGAAVAASKARKVAGKSKRSEAEGDSAFRLNLSRPSVKPRPVIQELN